MISNRHILGVLAAYLERYPDEAAALAVPLRLLSASADCASRRAFPVHATASALLTRGSEVLLVGHRAYGILLHTGVRAGSLQPER